MEVRATAPIILPKTHLLSRLHLLALFVGIAGALLCLKGAVDNPAAFYQSYLMGYLFWFAITWGSLALLMIHHVAGGRWGAAIRRLLESATQAFPLMAILFLPIVFGMGDLYEWAQPEHVAHDPVLQHKLPYLNPQFFLIRALIYFTVWTGIMTLLNRWSTQQDSSDDPAAMTYRMEQLSRVGLVAMVLTMTFAAVDWVMSLEPHWFSTIYGVLIIGGQLVTAHAFMIVVASWLAKSEGSPLQHVLTAERFHEVGKFLLAFVMLWTYFNLSQYLIIWMGNLPEETVWYLKRMEGTWMQLGLAVVGLHFILPFILLLSRPLKRSARALAWVARGVLFARVLDLLWAIAPVFRPGDISVNWMDAAVYISIGGIWMWWFVRNLKSRSLIAVHDPSLVVRG